MSKYVFPSKLERQSQLLRTRTHMPVTPRTESPTSILLLHESHPSTAPHKTPSPNTPPRPTERRQGEDF